MFNANIDITFKNIVFITKANWENIYRVDPGNRLVVYLIHINLLPNNFNLYSSAWHSSTGTHIFAQASLLIVKHTDLFKIFINYLTGFQVILTILVKCSDLY